MVVKIGVLLGDDIGGEVVPECTKVMKAAASRSSIGIHCRYDEPAMRSMAILCR